MRVLKQNLKNRKMKMCFFFCPVAALLLISDTTGVLTEQVKEI
jgi:hypothetical protein